MKIFVKAKPSAKHAHIERVDASHFTVAAKEPARDGKANMAVAKALARHLGIPQSCVKIIRGVSSKNKVFEVDM